MSVPEGVTVILTASGTWMNFLFKLQEYEVPPTPLVLQIIDQYIPLASFRMIDADNNDTASESSLRVRDACSRLKNLYRPPGAAEPSLRECYDLFTPINEDWEFDARGLTAELDNRVFQPTRRAQVRMRKVRNLTRLFGRLDAATYGRGGSDPYLAMVTGPTRGVKSQYPAVAAPVCQFGEPIAWEITIEEESQVSTSNNLAEETQPPVSKVFWQAGELTCPLWEAFQSPPLFSGPVASAHATEMSMAIAVNAWSISSLDGDDRIERDTITGGFDQKAINNARRFGNSQLEEALESAAAVLGAYRDISNDDMVEGGNSLQSSAFSFSFWYSAFALAGLFMVLS